MSWIGPVATQHKRDRSSATNGSAVPAVWASEPASPASVGKQAFAAASAEEPAWAATLAGVEALVSADRKIQTAQAGCRLLRGSGSQAWVEAPVLYRVMWVFGRRLPGSGFPAWAAV